MNIVDQLISAGVNIPSPETTWVADDIDPKNIEPGVTLLPGVYLQGPRTMIGKDSTLGPGGHFEDVVCGRKVRLHQGHYQNCTILDQVTIRSGAEIRQGSLFLENSEAAHTVGCKMTILGVHTVLGSLINFCDIFVSGGTRAPFDFTEIGSGTIHYNFTPNGLKFGSLIGPGALGEMYGIFDRTFIGGQTQIIAPTEIGSGVLVPAGTSVRKPIKDGLLSISPPLPVGEKQYRPDLITRIQEKVFLTLHLIFHYQALACYFDNVRTKIAQHSGDKFLEKVYANAVATIHENIQERKSWLFHKTAKGQDVHLFSKTTRSLEIHKENISKTKATSFVLQQIQEHQTFLSCGKELLTILEDITCSAYLNNKIWQILEPYVEKDKTYLEILNAVPDEKKKEGAQYIQDFISGSFDSIQQAWTTHQEKVEIVQELSHQRRVLQKIHPLLKDIQALEKFFITGNFNDISMGWLDLRESSVEFAWRLLSCIPENIEDDTICKVLQQIRNISHPVLLQWNNFWNSESIHSDSSDEEMRLAIERHCFRFHGTDGLRGQTADYEVEFNLKESIRQFIAQGVVTPAFFQSLARNSIRACEMIGHHIRKVAIGRDTRDLYKDDPVHEGAFYKALQRGITSAGKEIRDLGVIPIPGLPYFMCNSEDAPELGIYKSASHNPASQDGMKLFLSPALTEIIPKVSTDAWSYSKASARLEMIISALIFQEALDLSPSSPFSQSTRVHRDQWLFAKDFFERTMIEHFDEKSLKRVSHLFMDFAHGAFGDWEYQEIIRRVGQKLQVDNYTAFGNRPNGSNINNNQGNDRVGVAHFEGTKSIAKADIAHGHKFAGFPVLEALFQEGEDNDKLRWAVLTDGDGDRGYGFCFCPGTDEAVVVDGEKAFYLLLKHALEQGKVRTGDLIAVTVESSTTFLSALLSLLESKLPVEFISSPEIPLAQDKVNLKITPVGDKYILASQGFGVESSGHIIQSYSSLDRKQLMWVGNGVASILDAIYASEQVISSSTPKEQVAQLANLYTNDYNTTTYVYFVERSLWHQGSELWQKVDTILKETCSDPLTQVIFPEEPDTMYYLCKKEDKIEYSVLARLSGTEDKMGFKFYGSPNSQELFEQLSSKIFDDVAPSLKSQRPSRILENRILEKISQQEDTAMSVAELNKTLEIGSTKEDIANFLSVIEALSEKGQKMLTYDGENLAMTARGKKYLKPDSTQG